MKTQMVNHVETHRDGMFVRSTNSVKSELQALCERVEQEMRAQVLDIYNLLARDYLAVLVGVDSNVQVSGLPGPESLLRAEMLPILRDAARWFVDPAGGGDDDDPFKEESPAEGPSPCAGDDDDDDSDDLAAAQLREESDARARSQGGVGIKCEPAE